RVLAAWTLTDLLQHRAVELVAASGRDPALRDRAQRRRAQPALDHRALPEDRAGAELGERLPVDLEREHTVEHEEHLVAGLALLRQQRARLELPDRRLVAPAHDQTRQLTLERSLDRRHERGTVRRSPGRIASERLAVPLLE